MPIVPLVEDDSFRYGKLIARKFKVFYRYLLNLPYYKVMGNNKRFVSALGEREKSLKKYYPEKMETLNGISHKLGVNLQRLVKISGILHALFGFGCTTLAATKQATRDGKNYVLWNMDVMRLTSRWWRSPIHYLKDAPGTNRFIFYGIPGMVEISILNEHGLAFAGNAVGVKDGGKPGLLGWEVVNLAMETCSRVKEVVECFENTPILVIPGYSAAIFTNLNSTWANTNGEAVTIEYSRHYRVAEYAKEHDGVLVETNHHQYLDRNLSGSADPTVQKAICGSYARLGRAWELAEANKGNFDLEKIMEFARDHGRNYSLLEGYEYEKPVDDDTICCHTWNIPKYISEGRYGKVLDAILEGETLSSWIIDCDERVIWRTCDKPCKSEYFKIDCKRALQGEYNSDPNIKHLPICKRKNNKLFMHFLRPVVIYAAYVLERLVSVQ